MVDVNPIPFRMPPEPPSKKTDRNVDADAFHKEMHKRVEKVSETDQEQKKKRKRQEEAEEEEEPKEVAASPATPPEHVTPFSTGEEKKKVSPLNVEGGGKISPMASAQPTRTPGEAPPQSPMPTTSFSSDEMEDDSGFLDETAFLESTPEEMAEPPMYAPEQAPAAAPPTPSYDEEMEPPAPPPTGRVPMPETETPAAPKTIPVPPEEKTSSEAPPPPEKKKKKAQPQPLPPAPRPSPPDKGKKTAIPPVHQQTHKAEQNLKPPTLSEENPAEQAVSAEDLEEMARDDAKARAEETAGYFEQFVREKDKGIKKEVRPTETPQEMEELEGIVTPVTPLPPSDYIEKEKKDEEEVAALGAAGGHAGLEAPPPLLETTAPAVNNPYANLHPEIMDLFDRMVGTMTVMTHAGIKETVVSLDSPKFASSVFFGSQIIIQEYSTAPQAYNIQLNGSPEALALFQGNADELMAAFQYGNYNFRVNRLDTGLLGQKPLIKRKGPPSGGKEDKRGSER